MIYAENLEYAYEGKAPLKFPDIRCDKGAQWLLLGQSGSGKTTLLHLLGGLLSPQKGEVRIAETTLNSLSAAALDDFRGKHVGIIFQQAHFVRAISVLDNLLLAQQLAGLKPDRRRAQHLLEQLDIAHKAGDRPDRLSQGEQQRAAIARAIVNQPALIRADEPTSALDDRNCMEVLALLEREAAEVGATLLVVTHDNRLKNRFENHITLQPNRA